ncbi:hypothetical protein N7478_002335 [Penicillium angulare]|uniref:uncharacterized protein n=1 Tax=Penicillium angulare TaxID=116970 RepID=UPI00253FCBA5|nr:uncharacterized protein N7478_002335 [Penicillium angulare]KAJ5286649.1 hypothetical protein N7478_002335 [Penicillium angulare]
MRLNNSLMLLAALSTGVLARLEGHARRHVLSTTTVTELVTITACPQSSCASSTSTPAWTTSVAPVTTTPTPEYTPTPEPTTSTASSAASADWTSVPSDGTYSTSGFGASTKSSGSSDTYKGNVGSPYGSNIITVDASVASEYKYVVQFTGSSTDEWEVVIWNKYGEDGSMDGWFERACHTFKIAAGETIYYAFDTDSQGGWAAGKGSVPVNDLGEYASTWGEFDLGSTVNSGWSGFDVSAIVAQDSDMTVQGMKICDALGDTCSSITSGAGTVSNAYTSAEADEGGIGGNLSAGAVRLAVTLDYSE